MHKNTPSLKRIAALLVVALILIVLAYLILQVIFVKRPWTDPILPGPKAPELSKEEPYFHPSWTQESHADQVAEFIGAFASHGVRYVILDHLTWEGGEDEFGMGYTIRNHNPKLRTYILDENTAFFLHDAPTSYGEFIQRTQSWEDEHIFFTSKDGYVVNIGHSLAG